MYPTTVREFDGSVRPSPISIVREQIGPSVHFLDMEIIQPLPGACEVKMHDKRDNMPALASYRKFPHIETTISVRCKYAILHSQLYRFSYQCTQRQHFIKASSRLVTDMYTQGYELKLLRRKRCSTSTVHFGKQLKYWVLQRPNAPVGCFGIN